MKTFTVLPEHLKLLKRANWRWERCEAGAPAIDCKRPYGNSHVEGDVAEIIGLTDDPDVEFDDVKNEYLLNLHEETLTVLEIIFSTGIIEAGTYERTGNDYNYEWKKVFD